jgi:hypothetical protein
MAGRTFASVYPDRAELERHVPALLAGIAVGPSARRDAFALLAALEALPARSPREEELRRFLELATLRGLGVEKGAALRRLGVRTVGDLAAADPGALFARLRAELPADTRLSAAEVRVWWRAALSASQPAARAASARESRARRPAEGRPRTR